MADTSPLAALSEHDVAIWLDDLSRERLNSGSLRDLIDNSYVVGVTTNPTIFAKALSSGSAYDEQINQLFREGASVEDAVTAMTTDDVRRACDEFADVHSQTGGKNGRVSIEVDPRLAKDTEGTIDQARKLWTIVDRPNVMIKIPATQEGLPAITAAIAEGISVNVTLIFSLDRYRAVIGAYLDGLEAARRNGVDLSTIRSVASFFVSRVDTAIDAQLNEDGSDEAAALRGKAALANARLAYQTFETQFSTERWADLAASGANVQRPLWASTGVKDKAYSNTMYVDELVAPDTVNTMPEATLDAARQDANITGNTVTGTYEESAQTLEALERRGISLKEVTDKLEADGVASFASSWEDLLEAMDEQLKQAGN